MAFVWLAVAIAALVVEGLTMVLVSVWFIPGAIIALILALFSVPVLVQVAVFLVVSAACIALVKTVFRGFFKVGVEKTNTDLLIGNQALVLEKIDNINATGLVKINGQSWSAKSADERTYEAGELVNVLAIEGVKLVCNK